jgi:hypothetical protein
MNRICFFLVWGVLVPCLGQDGPEAVPAGNPTQFPPSPAEWTIDVTYKDAEGGASGGEAPPTNGRLQKVDVTQNGDVQRLILSWLNGKTTEQWHFDQERVTLTTNSTDGKPVCIPDYQKILWLPTGFELSAFQWVDRSNYQDTVTYKGKVCYHYKAQVKLGRDRVMLDPKSAGPFFLVTFEAWLDKATLFPVGLDDGLKLGVFTFKKDSPTGPLVPSPEIQEAFIRNTAILMPVTKR